MKKYLNIMAHYNSCLEKYGDTYRGVDWPNKEDADIRYKVMLELIRDPFPAQVSLLDFGCGLSHFYEYILQHNLDYITYSGLDISEQFIRISREKFSSINYYCLDILTDQTPLPVFDYIVMNGVFTEKCELTFEEMFAYFQSVVGRVFDKARIGIAFNVMSKHVDWERDDLFHLSLDSLTDFLTKKLSRHFVIRNDYGLYEYTTYLYKSKQG